MNWCSLSIRRVVQNSIVKCLYLYHCWEWPLVKVWSLGLISKHWITVYLLFYCMFTCCHIYFRLQLPLIIIHTTCILLSLRQTSAPIHLTSVLGVLGTQETYCIFIAWLLKRDIFDLFLPEFDKPWVIHLRKTCCCSTNLYTWRPNTVYKNRSVRRHHYSHSLSKDFEDRLSTSVLSKFYGNRCIYMHYLWNQWFGNNPGPMQVFERFCVHNSSFRDI